MQQTNPYATPNAPVSDPQTEGFGKIKLFTSNGRMGRLRYFLYTMLVGLAGFALIGLSALLFTVSPIIGGVLIAIIYIAMFVISILLTIQRCHDFNVTGWLSLLLLVFPASLVFYFIPGTKGSNQFGLMPPPNSKGVIVGAVLFPLGFILIFGIILAISLPYIDKAEVSQAPSSVEEVQDDATQ